MFNLLANSFRAINSVWKSEKVTLELVGTSIQKGILQRGQIETLEAIAIIQAENPTEMSLQDNKQDSVDLYSIWIIGDNLKLIYSKLRSNQESYVIWNSKRYKVYAKSDYSNNGWIECKMSMVKEGVERNVYNR